MQLTLRITPNARKSQWVSKLDDGSIKIKIAAPPVDGKANTALLKFLSSELGIAVNKLTIKAGETSRIKIVEIDVADSEKIEALVNQKLSQK